MILYIEALGSPSHPLPSSAWTAACPQFWGSYYGREQLRVGPLFDSRYSEAWVDFRGIEDAFVQSQGIDYFINSGRASESQQTYAEANPGGWSGYGANLWGLNACDGPGVFTVTDARGQMRSFQDTAVTPASGRVVPGVGRFDNQYLGIDQGPILPMLENYRTGLVCSVMRGNSVMRTGLQRAGFIGGWLAGAVALQ